MDGAVWAGVALLVALVLTVDRLMARAQRPPRRREGPVRRGRTATGGPGLGDVLEVFQPTIAFRHEEEQRQRHDLAQPGDAAPDWDVDLDAGTVRRPAGGAPRP